MAKEVNYQQLNAELDTILDQLQGGELDIDEAIKLHARGQQIVKQLETYLKAAQNKVSKISLPKK